MQDASEKGQGASPVDSVDTIVVDNPDCLEAPTPPPCFVPRKLRGVEAVAPVKCPMCGRLAVLPLTAALLKFQPDDTTHVCHPDIGGCNHGFAVDKPRRGKR
jgi:hypothetical protein